MTRIVVILLVVLATLAVSLGLLGRARQRADARRAFEALDAAARQPDRTVDHAALPADLPAPVRRWIVRAVPDGTPVPSRISLAQEGVFRMQPGQSGAKLTARQVYGVVPASFVWDATIRLAGLPFYGLDRLSEGQGVFSGRLLGLVQVAYGDDLEVRRSSMLRYLGELPWLPQAVFRSEALRWEPVDDRRARAFFTSGDQTVSGVFVFDAEGRPVAFEAQRPRAVDGGSELTDWRGEYEAPVRVDGIEVPGHARVSWMLPEGPFTYWEADIFGVRFHP